MTISAYYKSHKAQTETLGFVKGDEYANIVQPSLYASPFSRSLGALVSILMPLDINLAEGRRAKSGWSSWKWYVPNTAARRFLVKFGPER